MIDCGFAITEDNGKDFKEESIDLFMKQKGLYIMLLVYLLVFVVFFVPIVKTQYLIVGINGEGTSATMGYSYVEQVRKPIINIFSQSNPTNGFIIDFTIIDQGETSIYGKLYNLGTGESSFKINGLLNEKVVMVMTLYYGNKTIDSSNFEEMIR